MASSARIDELKRKFDDNPRRYFAPLANEYRKAGDPDQAIAICREFLPQQPGHMSGHIVYGQALFDAQQFEEAKSVFDMALGLDPENLIALRYLGDIARGLGDLASARAWYRRVLDADPRNDEIAAVLTSLAEAAPAPATPAHAAPEAADTTAIGPSGTTVMSAILLAAPEPVAEARTEPLVDAAPLLDLGDLRIEPETPVVPRVSTPRASLQSLGMEVERDNDPMVEPGPEPERVELATKGLDEAAASDATAVAATDKPRDPFATETMAELYLSQGHVGDAIRVYRQLLDARPGDAGLQAKLDRIEAMTAPTPPIPMAVIPAPVEPESPMAEPEPEPDAAQEVPDLDVAGFAAPPVGAGPSIREFLSALAGWVPRPGGVAVAAEPTVQPPVEDVRSVTVAEAVVDVFAAGTTDAGPTVGVERGGTIDTLFGGGGGAAEDQGAAATLARAFGVVVDDSALPTSRISGAPARRATTELSLDSVFREPMAPPSAEPAGFSFDRFFAGGTPAHGAQVNEPPAQGPPSESAAEDIEQFNSWLDGLKKR